jgi:hypothetical protein
VNEEIIKFIFGEIFFHVAASFINNAIIKEEIQEIEDLKSVIQTIADTLPLFDLDEFSLLAVPLNELNILKQLDELVHYQETTIDLDLVQETVTPFLNVYQIKKILNLFFDDKIYTDDLIDDQDLNSLFISLTVQNFKPENYHSIQLEDLVNIPFPDQIFDVYTNYLEQRNTSLEFLQINSDFFNLNKTDPNDF